jgi:hypothetical protein
LTPPCHVLKITAARKRMKIPFSLIGQRSSVRLKARAKESKAIP